MVGIFRSGGNPEPLAATVVVGQNVVARRESNSPAAFRRTSNQIRARRSPRRCRRGGDAARGSEGTSAMTSKRTLIRGGQIYDHDGDVHKPAVADILIEDDTIVSIGLDLAADAVHEVVDASGRLVVPGLINAHYHSH